MSDRRGKIRLKSQGKTKVVENVLQGRRAKGWLQDELFFSHALVRESKRRNSLAATQHLECRTFEGVRQDLFTNRVQMIRLLLYCNLRLYISCCSS